MLTFTKYDWCIYVDSSFGGFADATIQLVVFYSDIKHLFHLWDTQWSEIQEDPARLVDLPRI